MDNSKKQAITRTNKQLKIKQHLNDKNQNDVVYRYVSENGGGRKKGKKIAIN